MVGNEQQLIPRLSNIVTQKTITRARGTRPPSPPKRLEKVLLCANEQVGKYSCFDQGGFETPV